jgi:hypothetical protein
MVKGLFLDDERNPQDVTWIKYPLDMSWEIVRTYREFEDALLLSNYDIVSFDHDIQDFTGQGEERTGYTCFLRMLDFVMDGGILLPEVLVHSQNPVGAENIRKHYTNYLKFLEE